MAPINQTTKRCQNPEHNSNPESFVFKQFSVTVAYLEHVTRLHTLRVRQLAFVEHFIEVDAPNREPIKIFQHEMNEGI
jgi:hypothetical protein